MKPQIMFLTKIKRSTYTQTHSTDFNENILNIVRCIQYFLLKDYNKANSRLLKLLVGYR